MNTPKVKLLPASGQCEYCTGLDQVGKPRFCHKSGTIQLFGRNLCDRHAEYAMASACGRKVEIRR